MVWWHAEEQIPPLRCGMTTKERHTQRRIELHTQYKTGATTQQQNAVSNNQ